MCRPCPHFVQIKPPVFLLGGDGGGAGFFEPLGGGGLLCFFTMFPDVMATVYLSRPLDLLPHTLAKNQGEA